MEVGRTQTLKVIGEAKEGGWWVGDRSGVALLAPRHAGDGVEVGARIEVFVYADREGFPLATTARPKVERGGFACLEVVDVARHGAYLDWGLERDLFVPFGLQHTPMAVGDRVVVAVDVDREGRVYASSRLVDYLSPASGIQVGDAVELLIYSFNELGVLAVVDGRFSGMIFRNETFRPLKTGERVDGWVKALREDGRLDVTLHRAARLGTLDARAVILKRLEQGGGFLALTDASDPDAIRSTLQMSKKAFKKAVGSLYKERLITLDDDGIRLVAP